MFPGRGVPLRDRPVAVLKSDQGPRSQIRHCWVSGPAGAPGPWPGLILEWRKDQGLWSALVVYVIAGESPTMTVQTWVSQVHLRPA
jgi:hypothetical protein